MKKFKLDRLIVFQKEWNLGEAFSWGKTNILAVDKCIHSILCSRTLSMGAMCTHCVMTLVSVILKGSFLTYLHPSFALFVQVSNMLLSRINNIQDEKKMCLRRIRDFSHWKINISSRHRRIKHSDSQLYLATTDLTY